MNKDRIKWLRSMASKLDQMGYTKAADEIDEVLQSSVNESPVPKALEFAAQSEYLAKILDQRNPSSPNKAGSVFLNDQDLKSLQSAN